MLRKRLVPIVSLVLMVFLGCDNPEDVKYSFFVAGHAYGKPGRTELGVWNQFKDKFEFLNEEPQLGFGVLTGDFVRNGNVKSWSAIDADLGQLNATVYKVRGNHDGGLLRFETLYGKAYSSFKVENDLHIILDSNIGKWSIEREQLDFLKKLLQNEASSSANIFIYMHHIIWWNEEEYRVPYPNSKDFMGENLNFWPELFPLLKETQKPIYLFAGDVGAFDSANPVFQSYSYIKKDNVHLITSGMGGGKKDNFIIADVHNNNEVTFRLIHLNGNDINGLGKLEDYVQIKK